MKTSVVNRRDRVARRLLAVLRAVLYDPQAFTLRGCGSLVLVLAGLMAAASTFHIITSPIVVHGIVLNSIACVDLDRFAGPDTFGEKAPARAVETLHELSESHRKGALVEFVLSSHTWTNMQDWSAVQHRIICWNVQEPLRNPAYEQSRPPQPAPMPVAGTIPAGVSILVQVTPQSRAVVQAAQLESIREVAYGVRSWGFVDVGATAAGEVIESFASLDSSHLALHALFAAPGDTPDGGEPWKTPVAVESVEKNAPLHALESGGMPIPELEAAYDHFDSSRWFFSRIQIANASEQGVATNVHIYVDHRTRGQLEQMAGTAKFDIQDQAAQTTVEKVFPGTSAWAVFRSKEPIYSSEIHTTYDHAALLDPVAFRYAYGVVMLVLVSWIAVNLHARRADRYRLPDWSRSDD